METLTLRVNGATHQVATGSRTSLLTVLRDHLGLTGAKCGCGEGQCGACTVLVGGRATKACVFPVGEAAGKEIVTIEGLEREGQLHPMQQAFLDHAAFQCGYCTPGMILGAVALLNRKANLTPAEISRELNEHICRCGTYPRIVEAVRAVAQAGARGQEKREHGNG